VADVKGLFPTFVINLVPRTAATVAKTNGIGNTFGLDDDQSYICRLELPCLATILTTKLGFQLATSWELEQDDLRITSWNRSLMDLFHQMNKEKGLGTEFIYMGDAGETQEVFRHYGNQNFDKMRQIRDQYDPDLVFTRLNWGGFKLGY
jgi:hypothetical protein